MPLQRCKRETTSTEFVRWRVYFRQRDKVHTKEHHYLAQIALEVRRVLHRNPRSVAIKDFLLEFVQRTTTQAKESSNAKMQASKSAWLAGLGVKQDQQ